MPEGPFDLTTLPVFTTPDDLSPDIDANAASPVIPAKGVYLVVDDTVAGR